MKLTYNPTTGVFMRGASVAGSINKNGYRYISIANKKHLAHRLAWAMYYGVEPVGEIDHINGRRDDNRVENLRLVSHQENAHNMKEPPNHNTSGLLGVSFYKRDGSWAASIKVGGRKKHLGYYHSPEAAHAAYVEAKHHLHPTHRRLRP